jgi:hypothetical protein
VVYHGTNVARKFNVFKTEDSPSWFTRNKSYAGAFSNNNKIYSCFINVKKPLFVGNVDGIANDNSLKKLSEYSEIQENELKSILKESNGVNIFKITNSKKFKIIISGKGYDGLESKEGMTTAFGVFNPNQIKLADGTNTTFDKDNNDIRYNKGGITESSTPDYLKFLIG